MRKQNGFTLIELLVVIAIIALLLAILMPSLQRVKQQAQATACIGRLKQWALIFAMYTGDNNGYFHNREFGTDEGYQRMWPQFYRSYYNDHLMRCCPAAQNPNTNTGPFATWGWKSGVSDQDWGWGGSWIPKEGFFGSYAFSRYMLHRDEPEYWGRTGEKYADTIPVFLDSLYVAINPLSTDGPPQFDGERSNQMQYSCINRHNGYVNGLFLDWTARKIGLKELWTFRWSRTYDTAGPWTTKGMANPSDWPQWMKKFKDY